MLYTKYTYTVHLIPIPNTYIVLKLTKKLSSNICVKQIMDGNKEYSILINRKN